MGRQVRWMRSQPPMSRMYADRCSSMAARSCAAPSPGGSARAARLDSTCAAQSGPWPQLRSSASSAGRSSAAPAGSSSGLRSRCAARM